MSVSGHLFFDETTYKHTDYILTQTRDRVQLHHKPAELPLVALLLPVLAVVPLAALLLAVLLLAVVPPLAVLLHVMQLLPRLQLVGQSPCFLCATRELVSHKIDWNKQ
jgi:hypothetical protein